MFYFWRGLLGSAVATVGCLNNKNQQISVRFTKFGAPSILRNNGPEVLWAMYEARVKKCLGEEGGPF